MNDENNEKLPPIENAVESPAPVKPDAVDLPAELVAARAAQASKWDSAGRPGKWTTIGCGLGIMVLVVALFAGTTLMRRTVWTGFAGATQRLVASLPGDLPPGERMRLTRNLEAFALQLKQRDDPYPVMGEFQALVRVVLEDRMITRDEVGELNAFLESKLADDRLSLPYSMP